MQLTCVNHNLLQPIALTTGAPHNRLAMGSGKRPIFHKEIGENLAKLRTDRGLSQMQVEIASKGRLRAGTLKSIETGRIKNPDPDHLRELARIYNVTLQTLAQPFLVANYGRDLVRHAVDQQSESSSHVGDQAHDPASTRMELERLRTLVGKYETEAREVQVATDAIAKVALHLGNLAQIQSVARKKPKRGGGDRKVG